MNAIAVIESGRRAVLRLADTDREKLEHLLFHRYPDKEWGTFFRFGFRRTSWGLALTFVDPLKPEGDDLDRVSALVEFRPRYIRSALDLIESCPLGVGVIHSHPQECAPFPSRADDDMDGYFAGEFEKFSNGRPYTSIIVSRRKHREFVFSGRVFDRGEWLPLAEWFTVGALLRHERTLASRNAESPILTNDTSPSQAERIQERVSALLGERAANRLSNAAVAIIGCSGTGTPAAHVLARARIDRLVLVDPGHFKPSNHERNHASRFSDL
ncbi:MAG: ThiF family adenylyltransferase, partial [Verrucomicrobiales bacterium]|nr:ThiF family adenylyltransferase [Verrucomicrobiales bacterium]